MGGIYAASAFVILQAVQLFEEALGLPVILLRFLALMAIVGFPVTLVLAWGFQRTADGVVRDETDSFEWSSGQRVILAVAALATVGLAGALLFGGSGDEAVTAGGDASVASESRIRDRKVAIIPFANATGDPTLDVLGSSIADYITHALLETGLVEVTDALTVQAAVDGFAEGGLGSDPLRRLGEETGAAFLVRGSINPRGDSIELTAQINDSRRGTILESLDPIMAAQNDPLAAAVPLRSKLQTLLATLVEPALAEFDSPFADPPSYEAYQAYLEGQRLWLTGSFRNAHEAFTRAAILDTGFVRAMKWQLLSFVPASRRRDSRLRDSLIAELELRRGRLSEADRLHLGFFNALWQNQDFEPAYLAAKARAEAAPGSDDAVREMAIMALRTSRYREAIDRLRSLDPGRGLLRDWTDYWGSLSRAYLGVGLSDSALTVLDQAPVSASRQGRWQATRIAALASGGREAELREWAVNTPLQAEAFADLIRVLALRGHTEDLSVLAAKRDIEPWLRALVAYHRGEFATADSLVVASLREGASADGLRAIAGERAGADISDLEASLRERARGPVLLATDATVWLARLAMIRGNRTEAIGWLERSSGWDTAYLFDPDFSPLYGTEEFETIMVRRDGP